jgi:hypothetical protein
MSIEEETHGGKGICPEVAWKKAGTGTADPTSDGRIEE